MMQAAKCGPEWLSQQVACNSRSSTDSSLFLLDCRSPQEFNGSHISGAVHVALPTLMFRRLKNGTLPVASVIKCREGKERFNSLYRTGTLVLYDQDSSAADASTPSTVIGLLVNKLREDNCKVKVLEGGFMAFQKLFPSLCVDLQHQLQDPDQQSSILGLCNLRISDDGDRGGSNLGLFSHDLDEAPTPNIFSTDPAEFPVKVLQFLYLGNAANSADLDCLLRNDIKYILNVTPNVPNTFETEGTFKYMQIPISDHWSQNLSQWFLKAINFIDEARTKKRGVLVHCLAGISRSVTVTVAYLMHSHALELEEAYDFVKACKPNISPNFNFLGQLKDFENSLRCDCRARAGSTSSDEFTCTCSPKYYFSSPTATTPSSAECGPPESPSVPS